MAKRAGVYRSEKRKKELLRQKKQEEKRQKRQKDKEGPVQEEGGASTVGEDTPKEG